MLIEFRHERVRYTLDGAAYGASYIVLPPDRVMRVEGWIAKNGTHRIQGLVPQPDLDAPSILTVLGEEILAKEAAQETIAFAFEEKLYSVSVPTIMQYGYVLEDGRVVKVTWTPGYQSERVTVVTPDELAERLHTEVAVELHTKVARPAQFLRFYYDRKAFVMQDTGDENYIVLDDGRTLEFEGCTEKLPRYYADGHTYTDITFDSIGEATMSDDFNACSLEERVENIGAYYATVENDLKPLEKYFFVFEEKTYLIGKRAGTINHIFLPNRSILAINAWKETSRISKGSSVYIRLDGREIVPTHESVHAKNGEEYRKALKQYNAIEARNVTLEEGIVS